MQINNELVKPNNMLRETAREQLKGNWGTAVLICFVYYLLVQVSALIPFVGWIISLIIAGPLMLGLVVCFMKLVRSEDFILEDLFNGFKTLSSSFILYLLITVFTFLWTLLLFIPGLIAALRYSMAFYILNDNPTLRSSEALNASKEMMSGYKWKLFCLYLSFIGWFILCLFTLGIGFLWLVPYVQAAAANFYQNLKDAAEPPVDAAQAPAFSE